MKLVQLMFGPLVAALVLGCDSLNNPLAGLLNTGNDGRTYNVQTGQYEWPKDGTRRSTASREKARVVATQLREQPSTPRPKDDGRYFDPQKNRWSEPAEADTPTRKSKPAQTPVAAAPKVGPPKPTPTPRPPVKATGVYNPETGRFEWSDSAR